jgi:hypothetical protein
MIKMLVSGVWVCVVTLASAYAAFTWQTSARSEHGSKVFGSGLETVRTRMISVPVIIDGAIQGYVMAQLIFTIDSKTLKDMPIKPDIYLLDEAFKTIYGEGTIDFRQAKKADLGALSKKIADSANKRFGSRLVEDVLIQEMNYLSKDAVREGRKG